jgi:hypothetical protein
MKRNESLKIVEGATASKQVGNHPAARTKRAICGRLFPCLCASFVLLFLAGCKGCNSSVEIPPSAPTGSAPQRPPEIQPEIGPNEIEVTAKQPNDHEIEVKMAKINPQDFKGLQNALDQSKAANGTTPHVDIDVRDGQLVVKPDTDPAHLGTANATIRLSSKQPPIQAVVSPAARAYLQKH